MSVFFDIASGVPSPPPRSAKDHVREHLQQLCSGQLDEHLLAPDFGVGDALQLEHAYGDTVEIWCLKVAESIRRYESRLRDPIVVVAPAKTAGILLQGEVRGTLVHDGAPQVAAFPFFIDALRRMVLPAPRLKDDVRELIQQVWSGQLDGLRPALDVVGDAPEAGDAYAEAVGNCCFQLRESIRQRVPRLRNPIVLAARGKAPGILLRGEIRGALVHGEVPQPVVYTFVFNTHDRRRQVVVS